MAAKINPCSPYSNDNSTVDSNSTTSEPSLNQTSASALASMNTTLRPDLDGIDKDPAFKNPKESDDSAVFNPEENLNQEQSFKSSMSGRGEAMAKPMRHKKFKRKPNQTFEGTGFFEPQPDRVLNSSEKPKFQSNQNDEEIKDLGTLIEKWNPTFWDGEDDSAIYHDDKQNFPEDEPDESGPNRKDRDMFGTQLTEMKEPTTGSSSIEKTTTTEVISNPKNKSETHFFKDDVKSADNETTSTTEKIENDNSNFNTTIDQKEEHKNQTNSYQQNIQELARKIWVTFTTKFIKLFNLE